MKGRYRKLRRWISLASVFAIMLCTVPVVSATGADNVEENTGFVDIASVPANILSLIGLDESTPSGGIHPQSAAPSNEVPVQQIVDTDDFNSIRIEDSQGNGTAKIFATPVRYETDEGEIEFIDTSMTAEPFVTSLFSGYDYRNTANSFTLQYAKQPDTGLNMDGDFTMAVYNPEDLLLANGTVDQTAEGNGRITYPETFGEHTYLEYVNTTTGVKENIVLEENTGKNRFDFVFASDTHQPVLSEDGSTIYIVKKDDPEQQAMYTISPLYVYDSCVIDTESEAPASGHKHFTEDCHYEIVLLEDGRYRITSVVSEEFLNDPETTYPVIIDPTISNGASYVTDTYVSEAEPSKTFGSVDHLRFGNTGGKLMHTLIRFDNLMQSIPINAVISSASMKFTFRSGQTTGSTGALWRITKYWTENVPFSSKPSNASWTNYDASSERNYVNGYIDNYNFNVTGLVKNWVDGIYAYYGVYLTYTKHAVPDYNSVVSSDGEAHRAPTLTVNYTVYPPSGLYTGDIYFIRNHNSGKYLQAGSNGQTLTQQTFTGDTNQQWKLVQEGGAWYSLYPLSNPSLRIDVPNSRDINGQDLRVYTDNNTDAQRFRITYNGDYTYRIQPKVSYYSSTSPGCSTGMALDVTSASNEDGAVVQIWTYYDSQPQMKWVFEEYQTGAGGEYRDVRTMEPNCFGYALFLDEEVGPNGLGWGSSHNTENFREKFQVAIEQHGNTTCRSIENFRSPLEPNEYRVAVRAPNKLDNIHIYHVIYQLSDGRWAGKDNIGPSQVFDTGNPSISPEMWSNDAYAASAGTIYFAVVLPEHAKEQLNG